MSRQVTLRDPRFDGVKSAITFGFTSGSPESRSWAVGRWGEAGPPTVIEKAEVPAIGIAEMDDADTVGLIDRQLFASVRERAALFRLRGFRRAGFRVRTITMGGTTVAWVEEGKAIPVLSPSFDNVGLTPSKLAGISVWTKESLAQVPGIEQLVYDDLARAYAEAVDLALFDVDNDGSGGAPAAITNGAPATAATGDLANDLAALYSTFTGNLGAAYFASSPETAASLAATELGREVGARGGELAGVPVLTSQGIPPGQLTLVDPTALLVAFDEDLELATSRHGTVEMLDATLTGDSIAVVPGTAASTVPLWQANSVSIRAIGRVAWTMGRTGAVSTLTGLEPVAS
ncbi:MAG: phage major capsid protein [Tsuneonella sp.]